MINFYLVIAINGFLLWLIPAGTRYFEQEERRARARERASQQRRCDDGTFYKKQTPKKIIWVGELWKDTL